MLAPTARVVVEDDAADLTSFPDAGAVADHEPRASAVRESLAVLLARVRHSLQLEFAQAAAVDDVLAEGVVQGIRRGREGDGRQGRSLGNVAGVFDAALGDERWGGVKRERAGGVS